MRVIRVKCRVGYIEVLGLLSEARVGRVVGGRVLRAT